jgi:DNA methylase
MPRLLKLKSAARDSRPVDGLTHDFYRYPARFTPTFAATAISCYSARGDLVFDPFMGGGTTIVEAMVAGRRAIGTDKNSLAIFITRVKSTPLNSPERSAVNNWAELCVAKMTYRFPRHEIDELLADDRTLNLVLPRARAIKKAIGIALYQLHELPTSRSQDFARAIVLRTSQWALDNRKRITSMDEFRCKFQFLAASMLHAIDAYGQSMRRSGAKLTDRLLVETSAEDVCSIACLAACQGKVDLVVASPPYPGIHVLYHRWQVDGRKESPAPYWITDCQDGHGTAFYTFGDRRRQNMSAYFSTLRSSYVAIRKMMRMGAYCVQMVAFSDKSIQLPRYLRTMESAGFTEVRDADGKQRIWRDVPNRRWHAMAKGQTPASREVVLVHRAT